MNAFVSHTPALVLNADFRPLSYFPLSLWAWEDAIKAVFLERVSVIAEYEQVVRSPSLEMHLPSVVALKEYRPFAGYPAFTRFNVFLRDMFTCQYCGVAFLANDLTFDHIVPRCRGGETTWTNVVAACAPCNLRKGSRALSESSTRPLKLPTRPTNRELQENGRLFPPDYLHESWRDYLYWDSELET